MTNRELEKELAQLGRDVAPGPSLKTPVLNRLETIPEGDIMPPYLWRRIMTHPITHLAIAASILVALTLCVFFWEQTSNMALADALRSIDRIESFSLETRRTRTGQKNDTKVTRIVASEAFGMRMTEWNIDPNTQERHLSSEGVFSIFEGKVTVLSHEMTMAASVNLDANNEVAKGMLDAIEKMDPRTMLSRILLCEYHSIGPSEIDGKTVEGFQTTDPNYFRFRKQPGIIAIAWIDTESRLPVRIEETINWVNGNKWYSVSDFEWDIPLKVSDFEFELAVPDHYVNLNLDVPVPSPVYDPNSAISGLRYYREKHQRYPETLEILGSRVVLGPRLPVGLTDEQLREYLRNNREELKMIMGPLNGTIKLYRLLKEEKRDWAYYGDRVTPEMANALLWRWSTPEGGMYCVVLGDLRLTEVTKEGLRALEAELPD